MGPGIAAAWGALAASSLPLGSATLWLRPGRRFVGLTMGFGAGGAGLLRGRRRHRQRGGRNRKQIADGSEGAESGLAIFVGTLLDGIPESLVLGMTLATGGAVAISFLGAVFVSNLPEAIAATGTLRVAGQERRRILRLWFWAVASAAVVAAVGFLLVTNISGVDGAFAQAFGAGAVLTMLADPMMPEAFEHGGKAVGLLTVLGYAVATALAQL